MAEQSRIPLHRRSDEAIEDVLRLLSGEIDWPVAEASKGGPDIAAVVTARLVEASRATAEAAPPVGPAWRRWTWTPARRALVVAIIALLAFAAIVGAGGFGLPGLRILFGGPSPSPTAPPATPDGGPSLSVAHVTPMPVATARPDRRPRPARKRARSRDGGRPCGHRCRWRASRCTGRPFRPPVHPTRRGWTRPSTIRWLWCGPLRTACRPRPSPEWGSSSPSSGARSGTAGSLRSSDQVRPSNWSVWAICADIGSAASHTSFLRGTQRIRRRDASRRRRRPAVGGRADHLSARDVARARRGHRHRRIDALRSREPVALGWCTGGAQAVTSRSWWETSECHRSRTGAGRSSPASPSSASWHRRVVGKASPSQSPSSLTATSATVIPSSTGSPSSSPSEPAASDAWLVVERRAGTPRGHPGQHAREGLRPAGRCPDATWGHLVVATADGSVDACRALVSAGFGGASSRCRCVAPATIGADRSRRRVADGGTIVLVRLCRWRWPRRSTAAKESRFAIVMGVDRARVISLPGAFEYDAISPDGTTLYVVEHLPAPR